MKLRSKNVISLWIIDKITKVSLGKLRLRNIRIMA